MSERIAKSLLRDVAHSVVVPGTAWFGRPKLLASPDGMFHTATLPTIELVTEADVVRAIDVTCSCGQTMRLWCSYESEDEVRSTGSAN